MTAIADLRTKALNYWRPPPRLSLSEWADEYFYLSAESSAEAGKWHTIPYQRGFMDAITDPLVERVSVMKSARVGYTKAVNACCGYYIHQDPCPIMVVQPTIEDAEGYSKEEIAPMLRDTPVLAAVVPESRSKDSANTILHKVFPGGSLSMVGANSPRGFRRVSRKVVIFDEVDGYPASAGPEGDQIKLGITRTQYYWDRKIIAGSTPTIAGRSRIESMFNEGDQRRYYVPCPECHEKQVLKMSQLKWKKDPMAAYYECEFCGFHVEHKHKRWMVENGEWRAHAVFTGHASFHIWAAYSYSPNATWGHIAAEFEAANKEGTEALKTFVNTVLGETWQDRGDAPDWQRLYDRREHYARGTVPRGGLFLTAGVDVQKDRIEWEVVAWGRGKRSWSIDYGVEPGDTAAPEVWKKLDELIGRRFTSETGVVMPIAIMSVDSGYESQTVYGWCRRYSMSRVIAIKGVSTGTLLIGAPSPVDVSIGGRRLARGYKVWPVSGSVAKSELYGWLRLEKPTVESGDAYPPGYCHFPEYGEEYFKGLTGEQLIAHKKRTGFVRMEWEKIPGRRNEPLDCRCYARAAAAVFGIDRMQETDWVRLERETAHVEPEKTQDVQRGSRPNDAQQPSAAAQPKSSWIPRRPGWINRG